MLSDNVCKVVWVICGELFYSFTDKTQECLLRLYQTMMAFIVCNNIFQTTDVDISITNDIYIQSP